MAEKKDLSEEFFRSVSRELDYFFVELPKEVSDKVRYHIWLMGVFLGSAWIFIQAVEKLGLETWLPPLEIRIFLLSIIGILSLMSFAFAILSSSLSGHPLPNHRKLKSMLFEELKTETIVTYDGSFSSHWMDKMIEASRQNLELHEQKMKRLKLAFYCLLSMMAVAAIVPLWMLIRFLGGING